MDDNEIGFLLEKVRQGNAEAFAVLCEHFYPQVLKYMYYRVGAVSAEDLSGEVFLRVLCHINEQSGSFAAWLYKIASNVVTDYARKGKVRREGSTDEQLMDLMIDSRNPSEVVGRQIDIHDAMTRLTDNQRELIILKFIQGLSNAEIAQITGRSEGAIRGLQFRALTAMRLMLNGEERSHEH